MLTKTIVQMNNHEILKQKVQIHEVKGKNVFMDVRAIINTDEPKLKIMYQGDKSRDAKSTVRGFLFQDYVAIEYLLQSTTVYLCVEFLEDINVFDDQGNVEIVQAKYYPKTSPNMDVISTDLYYNFLRMQILKCELKCKPILYIARHAKPRKKGSQKMMELVGSFEKMSFVGQPEEIPGWLEREITPIKGKEEQKKLFFANFSDDSTLEKFLKLFSIKKIEPDIAEFQGKIANQLDQQVSDGTWAGENRKHILVGLAIMYIQNRYFKDESELDKVLIHRSEFLNYLEDQIKNDKNEKCISAYVLGTARQQRSEIIKNNDNMEDTLSDKLQIIAGNTEIWLGQLLENIEGQYQLLNTISSDGKDDVDKFKELDVAGRLLKIAEAKDGLKWFLRYLWKIMLDLNPDKVMDAAALKVESYLDLTVADYICVKFNKDVEPGIILNQIPKSVSIEQFEKIYSRIFPENQRPQKLYMDGPYRGMYDYDRDITQVFKGHQITNPIERDYYIIECMDCIDINKYKWSQLEKCDECIFSQECVKGAD